MRLVFCSLVLINVLIAIWGFFRAEEERVDGVDVQQAERSSLPSLVAQSDVSNVLGDRSRSSGQENMPVLCLHVGPFASPADAEIVLKRLVSLDIDVVEKNVNLKVGESYWVHLPAASTVESAYKRLSELQSQKIESYVIAKGELKNAISLGVFTRKPLAEARLAELKSMGLNAQIKVSERYQQELWLMLKSDEEDKMSDASWRRVLDGFDQYERKQNLCLPVAS